MVAADRQRLRQVALNLVSNAIKYNRRGGSVAVAVRRTPGGVVIDVTDTGHGISAEKLGDLFSPFEEARRRSLHHRSTGLGIALSKRIVEAMGGTISVASEVGRGRRSRSSSLRPRQGRQVRPESPATSGHRGGPLPSAVGVADLSSLP